MLEERETGLLNLVCLFIQHAVLLNVYHDILLLSLLLARLYGYYCGRLQFNKSRIIMNLFIYSQHMASLVLCSTPPRHRLTFLSSLVRFTNTSPVVGCIIATNILHVSLSMSPLHSNLVSCIYQHLPCTVMTVHRRRHGRHRCTH